ncbi:MAG: TnpV protein [Firmicutes bacterium]|nr:TnpV protein [Bacillota bacterium]
MRETVKNGMRMFYSTQEQKWLPQYLEENDLMYKLDLKTMTYLPLVETDPQEPYTLTMWGQRRLTYLKENKKGTYQRLMIKGLWEHLVATDKEANRLEDTLMQQMSEREGITEELKQQNQMKWVGLRNNLKQRVREIVLEQVIYA